MAPVVPPAKDNPVKPATPAATSATSASMPTSSSSGPSNPSLIKPPPKQPPYVPLDGWDSKLFTWSNDPKDMQIITYFTETPDGQCLSSEFNIPGLRPVLVKNAAKDGGDGNTYLIQDADGYYYLWNEADGRMWKFDKIRDQAKIVNLVATNRYGSADLVEQFERPEIDEAAEAG